jgi:hypothetical protein
MDKLTYLILKLDSKGAAITITMMLQMMNRTECCPDVWKEAKTILLPKPVNNEEERMEPGNWRPITLTSIIYRIMMCQISRFFQSKKIFKSFVDDCQKGFKKNIEGCTEHAAVLNQLVAEAIGRNKPIYIAALDCRDAFGSVSHELLLKNLEHLGGNKHLNNFIMDSYKNARVSIITKNGVTNEIKIRKGVKQGCPLSPLLFNICIDPIFRYIREDNPNSGFVSDTLGERVIQGYADDIILIADSRIH